MVELSKINTLLDQLAAQAATVDHQRGEHHLPLFDEQLFQSRSRLLVPCVKESQSVADSIGREQDSGRLTKARAEYLTERLISQIGAIQRELSTVKIRSKEPKHYSHFRKPINVLYQELAQHQEWERRLSEMVLQKQHALNSAPAFYQQQAQQALLTAEQRLERCKTAKLKIENQITYREKHQ
ncbi:primosomal replication protein [Vibrio sp. FNV 38]|nr:primosomal replication protein [Vibrio sp. FNV 38]